MMAKETTIKITKTTRTKLKKTGSKGETYNTIILKLIKQFHLPTKKSPQKIE